MHLPELGLLDGRHRRVGLDVADDVVDAGAGVGHQQHEAEGVDEARAQDAHAEGDGARQRAIQPGVHLHGEQRQEQQQGGARDGQKVRRVAQDGGESFDVREAHHLADPRVVLQPQRGDHRRHDG